MNSPETLFDDLSEFSDWMDEEKDKSKTLIDNIDEYQV